MSINDENDHLEEVAELIITNSSDVSSNDNTM